MNTPDTTAQTVEDALVAHFQYITDVAVKIKTHKLEEPENRRSREYADWFKLRASLIKWAKDEKERLKTYLTSQNIPERTAATLLGNIVEPFCEQLAEKQMNVVRRVSDYATLTNGMVEFVTYCKIPKNGEQIRSQIAKIRGELEPHLGTSASAEIT